MSGSRVMLLLVRTQRTTEASRLIVRLLEEHPGHHELLALQQLSAAQAPR